MAQPSNLDNYGFTPEEKKSVPAVRAEMLRLGYSEQQFEATCAWFRDYGRRFVEAGDSAGFEDGFRANCVAQRISDDHRDGLLAFEFTPEAQQPAPAPEAAIGEKVQLETMMADKNSEYWKGPHSAANQARYRDLVALTNGDTMRVPESAATALTARRGDIEKLMGDKTSAYWRGPQAEQMQAEYRTILDRGSGSAPASPAGNDCGSAAVVLGNDSGAPVRGS